MPERVATTGRPPEFCRRSCRQRDFESRQKAKLLGAGEHALTMTTAQLHSVRDDLYVLECAIQDIHRDDALASDDLTELRSALAWILRCAEPLVETHSRLF